MKEQTPTAEVAKEHGLSADEWQRVQDILGRKPTWTELGIFSVMWSEHCSYKSSRIHLRNLPTTGPQVIQGPGENAGVVDIGDNQAVVFKMESHNHPSFIEPYQGAATGVGGICRDVFTMGARPIALADALRFGRPDHPRTKSLVSGVVAGIGGYGNSFGVPTVAGDVMFDSCYDGNILVNAFCLGLTTHDKVFLANASGVGNPILYVGAKTGRDGIHGATMASAEFDERTEEKRPTVQVGDPFMEKLLLEACLELMQTDFLVGIQDMGAAGLTSSSVEMAARAGTGVILDLDKVPTRETGMTAYELMLSESQERMLMVVERGREAEALAIFDKWDLDAAVVGEVTDSEKVVVRMHGQVVAELPAAPLAEGLRYERPMKRPADLDALQAFDARALAAGDQGDPRQCVLRVLGSPNVASKAWVYHQYDHEVRHGTVVRPGAADAGVVRVLAPDGREKGIAISADCNSRFVYLDPYEGARLAVYESAANLVATGAKPLATTNCLNFGNPEKPEIMWQFAEAVRGIGDACREIGAPIVSGNVSLYNETDGRGIYPTPMIAMVGLMADARQRVTQCWKGVGDAVLLIGRAAGELGGSEYLKVVHDKVAGRPARVDAGAAAAAFAAMAELTQAGLLRSAHDVSEGGLVCAVAECAVSGPEPVGARVELPGASAIEALFAEGPARFVVSCKATDAGQVEETARRHGAEVLRLGETAADRVVVRAAGVALEWTVAELADAWKHGFERVVA